MQKQTFCGRTLLFAPMARLYASLLRGFCDMLLSGRAPSRPRLQGIWSLEKKNADSGHGLINAHPAMLQHVSMALGLP